MFPFSERTLHVSLVLMSMFDFFFLLHLALAWHPFHEEYFVSGSFDGSIFHWLVG